MDREIRSDSDGQEVPGSVSMRAERSVHWEQVERTSAFKELVRKKKAFVIPAAIVYVVLFMTWPSLGGLTTLLDGQVIGTMTWASVYGLALFAVVLVILHLYMRQAKKWDRLAEQARREASDERTSA